MDEMKIKYVNINDLHPYENNPRNNDEAVEYVANSIKEFGFKVPMVIDKNNVIVTGHTRLKAAQKLGITKIPCITANDLTDEQIKAFRLIDNKVGESSYWNYELLNKEIEDILNIDMEKMGFLDIDMNIEWENTEKKGKENKKEKIYECPYCKKEIPKKELIRKT
jgi:site-specific DNA-methyltransferase (adenine-specific)